ncbi:hypothetical protein ACPJHQ_06115 [Rossellomorea sp. H39__3]
MAFPSNDQFTPIEVGGVPLFDVVGDEIRLQRISSGIQRFPQVFLPMMERMFILGFDWTVTRVIRS